MDIKPGANIRRAGEDIAAGAEVIAAGTRLRAQHLGLAASVGAAELTVHRRLRVAVFSSGDELIMPGEPLGPGQIYNSNRFTLCGLLEDLGYEVQDLGKDLLRRAQLQKMNCRSHQNIPVANFTISLPFLPQNLEFSICPLLKILLIYQYLTNL